jgi:lipoprotein-anchoring transpeptidase ErfK/SrfK
MPYMQRLTTYGIALHAGQLPGYPASHGCIRLPWAFAKKLYGMTDTSTRVTVTREPVVLSGASEDAAE